MEQQPLTSSERVPRLNQGYLCKGWLLESTLKAIKVLDQEGEYIMEISLFYVPGAYPGRVRGH
jgi:hypothetical protein